MMEGWKEYKLGEIVDLKQGFALNKKSNHYLAKDNKGLPLLKISDLKNGTETLFVKENIPKQFIVTPSEIIYSRTGQVGLAFMGKTGVVYNNCFKVIPREMVYSVFLYQWLNTSFVRTTISALATGSAQPDLNHGAFKCVKINLPPLKTQRKIASILSGYDDLIENNLKRIQLLEEQAQQTYEEWFVRFKFPGYENVEIDDLSGLPVGWEKKKIEDVIEVGRGSSPRPISNQKYFEGGTIPWLKIADATSSHIYIYETKLYVNDFGASFSRKLPKGSIVVAASGTLGFPMILGVEACIHDGWLYFKGIDDKLKEYFYFSFIGLKSYFESISYGAAIQNINTGIVRQSPFIVPSEDISIKFKTFASKVFESISNLQNQNQHLKEARDILLPRLMRMIDVDVLDVVESLGMVAEESEKYN